MPAGEVILGIEVDGVARAYPIARLKEGVINETVGDTPIAIFSRELGPVAVAFDARAEGRVLTFSWNGERIVDLETGSEWTMRGEAIEGELAGLRLSQLPGLTAFWFSYVSAFPSVTVYQP